MIKGALLGIISIEKTARSGGVPADSAYGSRPDSTCASLHGNSHHGSTSLHGVHGVSRLHPSVLSSISHLQDWPKDRALPNPLHPFPELTPQFAAGMDGGAGMLAGKFGSILDRGVEFSGVRLTPNDDARTATSPASTDTPAASFGGMLIPIENVVIERRIGNGGASTTYKASLKPHERAVAIKVADPAADSLEQWKSEVSI